MIGRPFPNNSDHLIDLVLVLPLNSIDVLSMKQLLFKVQSSHRKVSFFSPLHQDIDLMLFNLPVYLLNYYFFHLVTLLFNFIPQCSFELQKEEWETLFFFPQKALMFLPLF